MPLLSDASALYVGDTPAQAVYLGDTLVWSSVWTPARIPGLAAWIDVAALVGYADGAPVSALTDNTGRYWYAMPGEEPFYRIVDGRPRLSFEGAQLIFSDSWLPTTAVTIVVVQRWTAASSYGMVAIWESSASQGHGYEVRWGNAGSLQIIGDYVDGGSAITGGPTHVQNVDYLDDTEFRSGSGRNFLWVNGDAGTDMGVSGALHGLDQQPRLGKRSDGYYNQGMISEVLYIDGLLGAERANLTDYLMTKHGLALRTSAGWPMRRAA